MQTTPEFMPSDGGGDPNADPGMAAPGAGGSDQQFMDAGATEAPIVDHPDEVVGAAQHDSFMGGVDSQHPVSGQMLTEDDTQVSPQEQHAYDDFVTRALLFISDPRKPAGKNGKPNEEGKAPRDTIIDHLNVKGMPTDVAVGRTTAQVAWLLFSNAKHQGVDYPPDVLYHGADEIMSHVYEIGVKSGAIKNPPAPDSPEEQKLLGMAKLYACQFFGNNVIDSGLNNQDEARAYYHEQMKREADSGALDNWHPGDQMNPTQLTSFLDRAATGKASLASMRAQPPSSISDFQGRGTPSLIPPGGAQQQQASAPDQQQAPPPDQAQPAPDQGAM